LAHSDDAGPSDPSGIPLCSTPGHVEIAAEELVCVSLGRRTSGVRTSPVQMAQLFPAKKFIAFGGDGQERLLPAWQAKIKRRGGKTFQFRGRCESITTPRIVPGAGFWCLKILYFEQRKLF
jgi:hypothetical protein